MGKLILEQDKLRELVLHQMKNYWTDVDDRVIGDALPTALDAVERGFYGMQDHRYFDGESVVFSPYFSAHWAIFLYRLSCAIYRTSPSHVKEADQVYYLNKVMHSVDWMYTVELPDHFFCEHPLGSVLGKAKYGDRFAAYQGTTVGGNRTHGTLFYPTIGDNVILFANATVLGDTHIGNNVVVSANSYLINERVPDNCLVFGASPDLKVIVKDENRIKDYTRQIWAWR